MGHESVAMFRKRMRNCIQSKCSVGELPKETKGHPGYQLARNIHDFCRQRDTAKEQSIEPKVVKQSAPQGFDAWADKMTSPGNRQPKRRRQPQQTTYQPGASSADAYRKKQAKIGQASINQDAVMMVPSSQTRF